MRSAVQHAEHCPQDRGFLFLFIEKSYHKLLRTYQRQYSDTTLKPEQNEVQSAHSPKLARLRQGSQVTRARAREVL